MLLCDPKDRAHSQKMVLQEYILHSGCLVTPTLGFGESKTVKVSDRKCTIHVLSIP